MAMPVIGLTCGLQEEERAFLNLFYVRAILEAGGIPFLLPPCPGQAALAEAAQRLDGLLLSGGGDLDPIFFGEEPLPGCGEITPERDEQELELVRLFLAAGKPVLGICRGVQVLNVALGGTIYQDLPSQLPGSLKHQQQAPRWYPTHGLTLRPGSLLERVYGQGPVRVNSFHHQAIRDPAPGLALSATAPDGVVEAVEGTDGRWLLGLQWHPEAMWSRDRLHLKPFQALVAEAAKFAGRGGTSDASHN